MKNVCIGVLAVALLAACDDGAKRNASVNLEEARASVKSSREWGADSFAPKLHAAAEHELAVAEKRFEERRYDLVSFPAQRAVDAARLARAQSIKLTQHSPKPEKTLKTAKAKVKK